MHADRGKRADVARDVVRRAGKAAANGAGASQGGAGMPGMNDAQIALCIQYAAEDADIDLDQLFESRKTKNSSGADRILEP